MEVTDPSRARTPAVEVLASRPVEEVRHALVQTLLHDVRSPLAVATGAVQTILDWGDQVPPDRQRALLQQAVTAHRFVASLLDQLEEVDRLEREPVQLVIASLQDVVDRVAVTLDGRDMVLDTTTTTADHHVWTDPDVLERLLVHMCLAGRGSSDGFARLEARMDGDHVAVTVGSSRGASSPARRRAGGDLLLAARLAMTIAIELRVNRQALEILLPSCAPEPSVSS